MQPLASNTRLLTIGLPVYNAMPYLAQAVDSLLSQTYRNFEVLAVVDGAEDGSLEYLRSVRDARLRVIEQQHCGLTFTLNRILRECETPWLVRQDGDDLSSPDRLMKVAAAIARHPDAGMFYSDAAYFPRGRSMGLYRCSRGTPDQIRSIARSGYVPAICHPSATLNVEKTLALGGYRPGIECEDADLWWRMALAYDIRFIPEVLVLFRQNAGSLTTQNLGRQALHGLYVQYLLLSQLHSRTAEKLADVEQELAQMLDADGLRAKEQLRRFNMHMGASHYGSAAGALLRTLTLSPRYMWRRIRDEVRPSPMIANGVEPALFQQRQHALWPQHSAA